MAKHTPTIFISYSRKDIKVADALHHQLSKQGLNVWSERDIKAGDDWSRVIEDALRKAQYYLILLTPDSVVSEWVNVEMGYALSRQDASHHVIPVLLKDVRVPLRLSSLQYIDGRNVDTSKLGEIISKIIKSKEAE